MNIYLAWTQFKVQVSHKAKLRYVDRETFYALTYVDDGGDFECSIIKDSGADQVDFEANYKSLANKKIENRDADGYLILASKPVQTVYGFKNLVDANGSRNMNVLGTLVTPVHFDFAPPTGEEWHIERLLLGLDDVGLTDMGLFGGIPALTNGLLVSVKTNGVVYEIATIKDNADIAMMFKGQMMGQSGVLDTSDGLYGTMEFNDYIHLHGSQGDYIRISVRDTLAAINIMRSIVVIRKVL